MVEKDKILKEQVKFTGLGDFKESYKYAYDWLMEENFRVIEEKYTEKVSGNEKEIEVHWDAKKKLTDYFRIVLEVKWKILKMTDVEVEMDGKKKNMNKFGELKIDITGILEKDYTGKWERTGTWRFWKDAYHKFIVPKRIEEKEEDVRKYARDFKDEMKAFFDLAAKR